MADRAGLTYADLAAFPDDGLRRELLDGGLLVSPAPSLRHQRIVLRLALALGNHIADRGGGELFLAPTDVVLADDTVMEPDLLVVGSDQADQLASAHVRGAPRLVIEVLSDARRDRIIKRDVYARHGVPEYWVVDPDSAWVEVYHPLGGVYERPVFVRPGGLPLTTSALPGLELDLTALFV